MCKRADVIDDHRAARAAGRRPAIDTGRKHEVVDDELAASLEQFDEARLAVRSVEDVILFDSDHWQPAALCIQCVSRSRGSLFLGEQALTGHAPFLPRDNSRQALLLRRHDAFTSWYS